MYLRTNFLLVAPSAEAWLSWAMFAAPHKILHLHLDVPPKIGQKPAAAQELAIARADLLADNAFALSGQDGPYAVTIHLPDGRLAFDIATCEESGPDSAGGAPLASLVLGIADFRAILRDYVAICESLYEARRGINLARVETIDMARRGLHDEGARLLAERLGACEPSVRLDHATARQLFTIIGLLLTPYEG